MRRGIILIILVLIFPCYSLAFDDGDFQYWNTESISWKINQDWKLALEEEFRFGDDARDFYYQHSDLGLSYSGFTNWLTVGLNYRHIFEEKSGDWKEENRPHLNAEIKWKLSDFSLSNRGRLEYRNREDADNLWQYRNKFTIKLPLKLTKLEVKPYLADEIFYDFDQDTLNRNRLYAGLKFTVFKDLNTDIFYLWQSSETNDDWNDTHALGTKLNFSF